MFLRKPSKQEWYYLFLQNWVLNSYCFTDVKTLLKIPEKESFTQHTHYIVSERRESFLSCTSTAVCFLPFPVCRKEG